MPDIHIHREHQLGLAQARKVAVSWAEKAEKKFAMECTYEQGSEEDTLTFARSGVTGTLRVDAQHFEMRAQLGFLFGAFKDRIEAEIGEQLDALLKKKKSAPREPDATAAGAGSPAEPAVKRRAAPAKPPARARKS